MGHSKIFSALMLLSIVAFWLSCKSPSKKKVYEVEAVAETTAVASADDAADDPAIWVHPGNVNKSRIYGTDKQKGVAVYNLDGEQLYFYGFGRINNIDVRYGFDLGDKKVDILGGSNRSNNTIGIWAIDPETGELSNIAAHDIQSDMKEGYGFCF